MKVTLFHRAIHSVLAVAAITCLNAVAQDRGLLLPLDSSFVLLSHFAGEAASAVACDGQLAVLVESSGLRVIDISDPLRPLEAGFRSTQIQFPFDVALHGSLALVAGGFQLLGLFDVSASEPPVLITYFDTPNVGDDYSDAVAVRGDMLFLATFSTGLFSIDVSDPYDPSVVGQYGDWGHVMALDVSGDLAYLAYETESGVYEGIHVVDVSDPAAMNEVGRLGITERVRQIHVESGRAFLRGKHSLSILDLADPLRPIVRGFVVLPWAGDVTGADTLAYATSDGELLVFSVSDSMHPVELARYVAPARITGVDVSGDLICLSAFDGLYLLRNDLLVTHGEREPADRFCAEVSLDSFHPHPVRESTSATVTIGLPGHIRLELFDVLGRRVSVPYDGHVSSGSHSLQIDASDLPAGLYSCRLTAGRQVSRKNLIVTR